MVFMFTQDYIWQPLDKDKQKSITTHTLIEYDIVADIIVMQIIMETW